MTRAEIRRIAEVPFQIGAPIKGGLLVALDFKKPHVIDADPFGVDDAVMAGFLFLAGLGHETRESNSRIAVE
jgi:hypothetical protein